MESSEKILKIRLDLGAKMPCYAYENDACMDIFSNEDNVIKSGEWKVVKTGVHIDIPCGYEIQVRSKSGLASKYGISVLNAPGVIDAGYTGEIGVILMNNGKEDFIINHHDKIAQIFLAPVYKFRFVLSDEFESSERENNGFGSTGHR